MYFRRNDSLFQMTVSVIGAILFFRVFGWMFGWLFHVLFRIVLVAVIGYGVYSLLSGDTRRNDRYPLG